MRERLRRAISLESHDLVTTVVRRGRGDLDLALLAEPVELLCRDLDGPAALHAPGRREARRFVIDRLTRSPAAGTDLLPRPSVVVAGLPGSGADELAERLGARPVDGPERLEPCLRTLDLERRWHLPGYAEWFDGADHTEVWAARSAEAIGPRAWWTSWSVLERLHELERTPGGLDAVVLVDEHDLRTRLVDAMIGDAVAERRRWSDAVDRDAVARYWSWRTGRLLDRREEWAAGTRVRVVRCRASDLDEDPETVVATVRRFLDDPA